MKNEIKVGLVREREFIAARTYVTTVLQVLGNIKCNYKQIISARRLS